MGKYVNSLNIYGIVVKEPRYLPNLYEEFYHITIDHRGLVEIQKSVFEPSCDFVQHLLALGNCFESRSSATEFVGGLCVLFGLCHTPKYKQQQVEQMRK